jgi:hypothetical protein
MKVKTICCGTNTAKRRFWPESVSVETKQKHIEFLKSLENYHLDEQRRLYVHAGFTNVNGVDYEYFPGLFYWDRTLGNGIGIRQNHGNRYLPQTFYFI